ncbi:MAG: circadian clock KaiB family protein [Bryobacterales bacterium]|nr:circadian clock KaiB family protein [Bryobacterales bacterium]
MTRKSPAAGKKARCAAPLPEPPETPQVHRYLLRLYVAGLTARSTTALANLKTVCESHLKGRYELEVCDIYQQPELARREQVVAVPTLIRRLPPPVRRVIGDMSREDRVLIGLDILPEL